MKPIALSGSPTIWLACRPAAWPRPPRRAGRKADEVRLVAVTKYVGAGEIRDLVAAGCTDLGESRPQQLWERAADLADLPVRWHMIGQLAAEQGPPHAAAGGVGSIRSTACDWPRRSTASAGRTRPPDAVLLEVNISGEAAKHGFAARGDRAAVAAS